MVFKKYINIAKVFRQSYITTWWYKKSWFIDTWKSYKWLLKAKTIKNEVEINSFWKEYQFNTIIDADIKEWDRLQINNIDYDVKWFSDFSWITFNTKMIILNKIENGT
jgi:hypothetical protein